MDVVVTMPFKLIVFWPSGKGYHKRAACVAAEAMMTPAMFRHASEKEVRAGAKGLVTEGRAPAVRLRTYPD